MPQALQYATSIVSPLVDKIDTIELTRKSRELRVAEEYAKRVMRAYYSPVEYTTIASIGRGAARPRNSFMTL